jgi:hypothetical protein
MQHKTHSDDFEGVRCDLDGPLPPKAAKRDPGQTLSLILLGFALVALAIAGAYGLYTGRYVPVLALWGVCSPFLTLLVRTYIAPFDGWR